ncbi:hypothetical protein F4818DRAFT_79026 [Hypoxylon cercidicola]|nr:hypothetical protein F4818DRAFT_79026 [Hypoxylon cercidicola]
MDLDSTGPSPNQAVTPGLRKSVPYGQACTNCSKAKCKCISRGGLGGMCERCQRLGKECIPSVSVRKRAARRPASERTAHLEEKLDDLVSILRAQAAGNPAVASVYRAATNGDLPETSPSVDADAATMELDPCIVAQGGRKVRENGLALPLPTPTNLGICNSYSNASYPTPPSVASSQDASLLPPPAEAEETLRVFREHFLEFFPFVYIPRETTAAQLQQEKPVLWLNILVICSKSPARKAALAQKARETIAQKMLLDLDRNVDLLLGLLAYLGWGMHHFSGKPYIVAYVNLAMTIVTDLRLDKPPQDNGYKELHCFKPSYPYPKIGLSTHRTNEERRAVLACFVLCSSTLNFLRTQTMRWTAHMEDSLQKMAADPECLNDQILVTMVRLFRIQEDIAQITWRSAEPYGNATSLKAPPFVYVGSLRTSLEAVKKQIPPELADNKVVLSHIYAAELSVADMALWNVNPWLTTHPLKPTSHASATGNSIELGKIDAYYASLQASKALLENYLRFSPAQYLYIPFSVTLHFGRAAQTVYRLLVVDDPDWDRAIVKNSIDLMAVMEQTAANYQEVHRVCGLETTDDPETTDYYTKAANALRATIPAWMATLEQCGAGSESGPGAGAASGAGAGPASSDQSQYPIEFTSMEWLDDPWLTDNLLRSYEGNI